MAVHRGTMVAVGQRSARPRAERPDLDQPLAWWSTDNGDHWHAASVPGTGRLTAVAAMDGGFLAVGQIVDDLGIRSVVLLSDDGQAWSGQEVPGLTDVVLDAIVLTPRGPILAGFRLSAAGHEPLALVRRASTGWRPTVLPGRVPDGHAEIRGGCVTGDDVVLVGRTVGADGTRAPLVVRSSDLGETWRIVPLPGPVLVGPDSRANGCGFVSGLLAIVGATEVDGYDRAFVSMETAGDGHHVNFLDPPDVWPGHTLANSVVSLGPDLVVVGHDTSLDPSGTSDLAVWLGGPDRWMRLDALDELGSGVGGGGALDALVVGGVVIVGGTTSDRAVVWRSSPDRARKLSEPTTVPVPPARGSGDAMVTSLDPTGENWLTAHGGRNACDLVDPALLRTVLGAEPTIVPVSASAGIGIECRWRPADGNRFVSIEVTPARRLDAFDSTYPFAVTSRQPIPDICEDAHYYGAVQAAVARCGDSAVAVNGLGQEGATVLLQAVIKGLTS